MGGSAHVRRTLAGVLLAGAIGTPATPAAAAVPGAPAKVRAAITEQRRALRALPPSGRSGAGYRQSLAHVRAALNDLVAAERKLAASARETGPLPKGTRIQSLLDIAFAHDNHAATQLSEALWLIDRGAPPTNTSVAEIRADLRRTLTACTALAKLVR